MMNAECGMMNERQKSFGFNSSFRIPHSSLIHLVGGDAGRRLEAADFVDLYAVVADA
jgi:hypothetical protein